MEKELLMSDKKSYSERGSRKTTAPTTFHAILIAPGLRAEYTLCRMNLKDVWAALETARIIDDATERLYAAIERSATDTRP